MPDATVVYTGTAEEKMQQAYQTLGQFVRDFYTGDFKQILFNRLDSIAPGAKYHIRSLCFYTRITRDEEDRYREVDSVVLYLIDGTEIDCGADDMPFETSMDIISYVTEVLETYDLESIVEFLGNEIENPFLNA